MFHGLRSRYPPLNVRSSSATWNIEKEGGEMQNVECKMQDTKCSRRKRREGGDCRETVGRPSSGSLTSTSRKPSTLHTPGREGKGWNCIISQHQKHAKVLRRVRGP